MNHSDIDELIKSLLVVETEANFDFPLGPTSFFPDGKLTEKDEGEVKIAIGAMMGKVVIDFGKPTAWIGFSPEQAREIAASLICQADTIKDVRA